jgi:hypothetical protein
MAEPLHDIPVHVYINVTTFDPYVRVPASTALATIGRPSSSQSGTRAPRLRRPGTGRRHGLLVVVGCHSSRSRLHRRAEHSGARCHGAASHVTARVCVRIGRERSKLAREAACHGRRSPGRRRNRGALSLLLRCCLL